MKRGWIIHMMRAPRTFNQFDFFCLGWSANFLTMPDFRWDLAKKLKLYLKKRKQLVKQIVFYSSWLTLSHQRLCWLWKLGLITSCHGDITKPTIKHLFMHISLEKSLSLVQVWLIGAAFLSLLMKFKGSVTKSKRQTSRGPFCQILRLHVPPTNPLTKKNP